MTYSVLVQEGGREKVFAQGKNISEAEALASLMNKTNANFSIDRQYIVKQEKPLCSQIKK